jgi:hypothetical protein
VSTSPHAWPPLPAEPWDDTITALHLWSQIVGKVRLARSPWVNHSWHVTLYVTPRGLTTTAIPHQTQTFQIDFDLIDHRLVIEVSDGSTAAFPLEGHTVASFYRRLMGDLDALGVPVRIHPRPNEVAAPLRFDQDAAPRPYTAAHAHRFWQILVEADRVMKVFRARFLGKCSPVHFFWGAPDLAVTRFSGRRAPEHPGGVPNLPDTVTREAYSHEVSSAGLWAGGGGQPAAFYSYAYPEPQGFAEATVEPSGAFYSAALREFLLPYSVVQASPRPDDTLLAFLQSTYDAAANLAHWDRAALERPASAGRPI